LVSIDPEQHPRKGQTPPQAAARTALSETVAAIPGRETPTRADLSSVLYRRWLKEKELTYGTEERGDRVA